MYVHEGDTQFNGNCKCYYMQGVTLVYGQLYERVRASGICTSTGLRERAS